LQAKAGDASVQILGQPTEAQLKEFAAKGVKSVINLSCVAHEAGFLGFGVLAREKELVESLGVQYRNIPINPLNVPTAAEVKAVQDAVAALPKPVLVHCSNMERAAYATGHKPLPGKADLTKPLRGKPIVECIPHFETATCCFGVSCPETKLAMIVDPVMDFDQASGGIDYKHADSVVEHVKKNGLHVVLLLETHAHADHLTSMQYLKQKLGNPVTAIGYRITEVQKVFGTRFNIDEKEMPRNGSQWDWLIEPYQEWSLGNIQCVSIPTPGHTPACMCHVVGDAVFTGDTLFLSDIGTARCDFPGGSVEDMWESIQRLFSLPDATRAFVGHDYPPQGRQFSWETTIGKAKAGEKMVKIGTKKEDFIAMRRARDATLGAPRLLLPSIQVNIRAGRLPEPENNGTVYLKLPVTIKSSAPAAAAAAACGKVTTGTCG